MKFLVVFTLLTMALGCNAGPAVTKKNLPINKDVVAVKKEQTKAQAKKEEDCDDKAKKPIEIKEETISLTGNTGCSLDEAKP
ncbi:MAG: hypothetical protein H0V66_08850, partial [Bdellovibrionales bacterium]|nr:hypothetical protein [Bdellovibrionales bacterium]